MAKKDVKKNTKKNKPVKGKGKPVAPNPVNSTTLGDIIKDAEQAIVVTVTKGQIEVTGIKAINYAYQAKGLLVGAMDNYNNRPILNGLNNNTSAIISHLVNINNKLPEKTPVPGLDIKKV